MFGQIIFRASDWTAASTKQTQHGSKQTLWGYTASGFFTWVARGSFSLPLVSYSNLLSIPLFPFSRTLEGPRGWI